MRRISRLVFIAAWSCVACAQAEQPSMDYPFIPVPFTHVLVTEGLWGQRIETNRRVTIRYDFGKCDETGRIANFAKAGKLIPGDFVGTPFDDSDVFKVIEGASYSLAGHPDADLDKYLDGLIFKIAAAQEADGYLYSARTINPQGRVDFFGPERWTKLAGSHELYNVGHLYEAAVAHHLATGKRSLLDVALKNADLLVATFGPGPNQRRDPPGHQEVEIGLVKLYRLTHDPRYLELAQFFLDQRGRANGRQLRGAYQQDHLPVVEQTTAVGHSVRAAYMYCGMADVAALTGNPAYISAIDRIWENVVSRKLYLTGGIGAERSGEAFGDDYFLPNAEAYNETCAAIANVLWNHRMFLLHGDSRYVDVMERTLYNGFLVGVSMSGDTFFYPNPLAADGRTAFNQGRTDRSPWFGCACCPVNIVRFFPSMPGLIYAQRHDELYVNLYLANEAQLEIGGSPVTLTQTTDYPWEENIRIELKLDKPQSFPIKLRIPGWARGEPVPSNLYQYVTDPAERPLPATLLVNGEPQSLPVEHGYLTVTRPWKSGDNLVLKLPMPIRRVTANEAVAADRQRVAMERGPIVYCVEGVDHEGRVADLLLTDDAPLKAEHRHDFLGGVTVVVAQARRGERAENGELQVQPVSLLAIPYYAWCHRGATSMAVWLPRDPSLIQPRPRPTVANQSRPSASHTWAQDTVRALNDDLEPANSGDHGLPRFTWWDHRGTREWVQYDFSKETRVTQSEVYWFDDTGRGQCRVPQSWRVLYLQGEQWKPVQNTSDYEVQPDIYNRVQFEPVTTKALRLEVQLQPEASGGILEWKVGNEKDTPRR